MPRLSGLRKGALISLLLIALLPGASLGVRDEMGREVDVPPALERIVSLAPSITEILFALGLGDKVVGVTAYCNFPPEVLEITKIGGLINPSSEKILSLSPDLVIATAHGNRKSTVRNLERLGLPVYVVNSRDMAGIMRTIEDIGNVTGRAAAARRVVAGMKGEILTIARLTAGRPRPRVLYIVGHEPLVVAGPGTFAHDLIRRASGENVASDSRRKYPRFSMEAVLLKDPEVIILSDMGSEVASERLRKRWLQWGSISAVRKRRVYIIEGDLIHRPTPRIVQGLREMVRAIHPELFPN